jgi:hypothetical protein
LESTATPCPCLESAELLPEIPPQEIITSVKAQESIQQVREEAQGLICDPY